MAGELWLEVVILDPEPDDESRWFVILVAGGATRTQAVPPADARVVRLSTDTRTATAITAGDESPERAFLDGRLRIGGDTRHLVEGLAGRDAATDA